MAHGVKLDTLSMEDLQSLISDAQRALTVKVDAERAELLKKLQALDAIAKPRETTPKRSRNPRRRDYRHPNGSEFSKTSDQIPNAFKKIGVTTWDEMEAYRITE